MVVFYGRFVKVVVVGETPGGEAWASKSGLSVVLVMGGETGKKDGLRMMSRGWYMKKSAKEKAAVVRVGL